MLDHVGERSPYRGGRQLLELLRFAIGQADECGDRSTSESLVDALDYATGKIFVDDFEAKHGTLTRHHRRTELMALILSGAQQLTLTWIDDFLDENPSATTADLRRYFEILSTRSLRVLEDRESGRYRVAPLSVDWAMHAVYDMFKKTDGLSTTGQLDEMVTDQPPGFCSPELLLQGAIVSLRRNKIREIRDLADSSTATETDLQKALRGNWWIFGGTFVGEERRRRLLPQIEIDLPLLLPGGVLHIIELKGPATPTTKRYRPHVTTVTAPVNDAVNQVIGYLRMLDENRDDILRRVGIDTRRCGGTVVIGDPAPRDDRELTLEVLRTFNSHLSRVQVVTYHQLLDSAERSLDLEMQAISDEAGGDPPQL
ncbi:DUF4263 domain-containing protein [Frankia sp. CNm7]|uniref:DUF4263 domain-containing protein n=1 Tax=Frankia nepalensis TaxID=1836974 RepID=A0A937RDA5_9ACTN|nr:Shedu anti-phage system protein SduA domain-containing protein [Frankia nepalensis]MBL7501537.1 DUF4263 domain-containing protein [Frankia nepalensis]MBL7513027.1 DUF4263 domain-containing protein [Frankia nepalensis]MBL7518366.1 DUF4263 domain-containing protein [Frankia nepalensis]MBL7630021.1 DUF4263 domain-containing protein [Frankia nepalensis]